MPLAFNPGGGSPFELPKAALLRALVLLMCLAAFVRIAERGSPGSTSRRSARGVGSLWPALVHGLALTLAAAWSVDRRVSLWGSYERQQGLLALIAYLLLFAVTAASLRSRDQADRLWRALVWGSAPVVGYGLAQAVGLDRLQWQTDAVSPVLSTIGRANFLGSYLVLVLPLTAGRLLVAKRRWPYVPLLAGQLTCLIATQGRGAWVGFGVAMTTFGLVWALATRRRWLAFATVALAIAVVFSVVLLNLPGRVSSALSTLPGLARLASLASFDAGSTAARLATWQATLPLVAERPWLGYGPETMRTVFVQVFPPQLVYYQGRHTAVDRAHNLWLDLAMSSGAAGMASFLAVLVGFGRAVRRGLGQAFGRWSRALAVALAAAVAGHLADLQFGFDLTATATVFWLVLALAAALGRGLEPPLPQEERATGQGRPTPLGSLPYLLPALAVVVLIGLVCLRPLLADLAYWRSQHAVRSPEEALDWGTAAIRLWPLEPHYRLGLSRLLLQRGDFAAAEAQLVTADRLSPADPRAWAARAEVHVRWGQSDPAHYALAEEAYRQTLEWAPNVAGYHAALGTVLVRQGRLEEALRELERAVDLDATDGAAYAHLAEVYQALGRTADAAWARMEARRWSDR